LLEVRTELGESAESRYLGHKVPHTGKRHDPEQSSHHSGHPTIEILCATGAAFALLSSAALADFYVVQEKSTKECKIVETRPTETTWVQVGPLAFKTRDEAEKQIKVICKR